MRELVWCAFQVCLALTPNPAQTEPDPARPVRSHLRSCLCGWAAAELQLLRASSVRLSGLGSGSQVVVNGLASADTNISSTLYLTAQVSIAAFAPGVSAADIVARRVQAAGFSGTNSEQIVMRGGAVSVACALIVEASSGVTVDVTVEASGGSNNGDLLLDGDGGSLVLSTPATGTGSNICEGVLLVAWV